MVTKIDRLGNSEGEKEEMVSKIKKPPIIVALIIKRSFASMFIMVIMMSLHIFIIH
jgi:hypothetical protein